MEGFKAPRPEKEDDKNEEGLDARALQQKLLREAIKGFYKNEDGSVVRSKALQVAALAAGVTAGAAYFKQKEDPEITGATQTQMERVRVTPSEKKLNKSEKQLQREQHKLTPEEVGDIAFVAYREAGNERVVGKIAVAQIVLNRYLSGKYADDIHGVIFQRSGKRYQFDGVDETQDRTEKQLADEAREVPKLLEIFSKSAEGKTAKELVAYIQEYTKLPLNVEYYKTNDLDEYNPKTKMSKKNREFFQSLQKVASIGSHGFYIEKPKIEAPKTAVAIIGDKVIPIPANIEVKKPRAGKHGPTHHNDNTHLAQEKLEKKRASRG